ncbi:hypothetical protein JL722_9777 [Aureococcus anophagefferens]|nr:hypothetical protein JL722_9777 [Aureococcus anophagefferens]
MMTDAIAAFDARLPPPAFRPFHASQPEFVEAHVDALCRRGPSPEAPPARDEGTSAIMEPTRQPGDVLSVSRAWREAVGCARGLRGAAGPRRVGPRASARGPLVTYVHRATTAATLGDKRNELVLRARDFVALFDDDACCVLEGAFWRWRLDTRTYEFVDSAAGTGERQLFRRDAFRLDVPERRFSSVAIGEETSEWLTHGVKAPEGSACFLQPARSASRRRAPRRGARVAAAGLEGWCTLKPELLAPDFDDDAAVDILLGLEPPPGLEL